MQDMKTLNSHDVFETLDGARLIRYRPELALLFVWNGGHTVNVFDPWWRNIDMFSIGDFAEDSAEVEEVERGIRDYIDG